MNVSYMILQKVRFSVNKTYFACQYLLPVINMLFDRPLWSFLTDEKKNQSLVIVRKKDVKLSLLKSLRWLLRFVETRPTIPIIFSEFSNRNLYPAF